MHLSQGINNKAVNTVFNLNFITRIIKNTILKLQMRPSVKSFSTKLLPIK